MSKSRNLTIHKQGFKFYKLTLNDNTIMFVYGRNNSCAKSRAYSLSHGKITIEITELDFTDNQYINNHFL